MPRTQNSGSQKRYTAAEKRSIREGLRRRLADLQAEMAESKAVASDLRKDELSGDEADAAAVVTGHDYESAVSEGFSRKITEVEHALSRLSQGDYGRCERCDRTIPARRLVAFPAATLCVECKQHEEQR